MNTSTHVQLSGLAPALADLTGVTPPSYRKLLDHARDGLIRTEVANGRHFVPRSDLEQIADNLGLIRKSVAASAS